MSPQEIEEFLKMASDKMLSKSAVINSSSEENSKEFDRKSVDLLLSPKLSLIVTLWEKK